ncbi:SDR family oxidoreductase [Vibrio fluvialis]|uniref:SDR family oxidoreductase n=1 Tax=Vibrio fluvialis TaxID=676 RepID=UPI001F1661B8|nr:SDR family oxidoreductase [Vibrio fluvialis]MCE7594713.1 SDR family oxidoreductase [Vibrio fluvialis]UPO64920.1 UDP-glucose 4-epimerase [Vibrio fluvialis]
MLAENRRSAVILIGKGLVGNSIYCSLLKLGYVLVDEKKLDWTDPGSITDISCFIDNKLHNLDGGCQLTILWSAGRLGFGATNDEIVTEQSYFENVCLSLSELGFTGKLKPRFILFSSIGGLFEGQNTISDSSIPAPKRPYGVLKLHQEETAQRVIKNFDVIILRLSSVYGPIRIGSRMGLIQVLILNGLQRRNSMIFGTLDTLRDYVFVDDIARFVVELVGSRDVKTRVFWQTQLNITDKAYCRTFAVQAIVSVLFQRKAEFSDIPCVQNNYQGLWLPSSLDVNIKKIYVEWLSLHD